MQGQDQRGTFYSSISEMWQSEINQKSLSSSIGDKIGSLKNWYGRAQSFWDKSDSDYNGVLNGYGYLSQIDLAGSHAFLKEYLKDYPQFKCGRVLDCGAGIGRIAKQFLCHYFLKVDLVDQCQKYIQKAKILLSNQNIGKFYAKGLQDFQFQHKYDCIWIQWVLAHLTDQDAQQFLRKAKLALNQNGIIVVKQNHNQDGFLVDKEDCSVSRSAVLYKQLFRKAQLKIIKQSVQKDWPEQLQEVRMYLLQ